MGNSRAVGTWAKKGQVPPCHILAELEEKILPSKEFELLHEPPNLKTPLCVEIGFYSDISEDQAVTVKLKSELIFIKF